jgi:hypothetical protein
VIRGLGFVKLLVTDEIEICNCTAKLLSLSSLECKLISSSIGSIVSQTSGKFGFHMPFAQLNIAVLDEYLNWSPVCFKSEFFKYFISDTKSLFPHIGYEERPRELHLIQLTVSPKYGEEKHKNNFTNQKC